jgi:hypothetical protein
VGARRPIKHGTKTSPRLTVHAPRAPSGAYLLKARQGPHATRVPFAVQARRRANVLLVLPYVSWQGANRVDDDQDGIPNTLEAAEPSRLTRPFAGLPAGFAGRTAPLLAYLDHAGLRYDVAYDVQLAGPHGPALLRTRRGVLLAGDARWLPRAAARRLRGYVEAGGRVASTGVGSLRSQVAIGAGGALLERPTAPAARDIFGSRIAPLVRRPTDLVAFGEDRLGLFAATGGAFSGFDAYEPTTSVSPGRLLAAAGPSAGTPVIVALRLGAGLVIRFGTPQFAQHLAKDPDAAALMRRTWTLLSR